MVYEKREKDGGEANRVKETWEEQKEESGGGMRTMETKDA